MFLRAPCRAGSFYEASPAKCRSDVAALFQAASLPDDLPQALCGGLVPHAGWVYSGRLAAKTLKALCADGRCETVVLLGADHTGAVARGEVFDAGAWQTPLGEAAIDEELASALAQADPCLQANPRAHAREHSIEVQVPLVQFVAEQAKIVPVAVPPTPLAVRIGQIIGQIVAGWSPRPIVVGSTDLTHHGGHFGSPGGRGEVGERWTRKNDRRMLDLIEQMEAEKVILEAGQRRNACGAGAIAATIAACRQLGATRGVCLEYTNSYQITHAARPDFPDDTTVGYASVVFA